MNNAAVFKPSPLETKLFSNARAAWFWLVVRIYVGWVWLQAGWHKVGDPAWTGDSAGQALTGFVQGALEKVSSPHPDVQGWYAAFLEQVVLENAVMWGQLVVWGGVADWGCAHSWFVYRYSCICWAFYES